MLNSKDRLVGRMTFSPDILWMSFNPLVGSCLVSQRDRENMTSLILESLSV